MQNDTIQGFSFLWSINQNWNIFKGRLVWKLTGIYTLGRVKTSLWNVVRYKYKVIVKRNILCLSSACGGKSVCSYKQIGFMPVLWFTATKTILKIARRHPVIRNQSYTPHQLMDWQTLPRNKTFMQWWVFGKHFYELSTWEGGHVFSLSIHSVEFGAETHSTQAHVI